MATLDFNANDVAPTTPFEPLPAGKYLAEITASEMKPTKAGNGNYLQLEFTVLDGPCKGRRVWDRLCISHPNDLTQKSDDGGERVADADGITPLSARIHQCRLSPSPRARR